MALISAEKLAQKTAQDAPFANTKWYAVDHGRRRILFQSAITKKGALALRDGWEAENGFDLNTKWAALKAKGYILEPGEDKRGGDRSGRGKKVGRKVREDDGAGVVAVYLDAPTILLAKTEAKRCTQASRLKDKDAPALSVKDLVSGLILNLAPERWPDLLDCWEPANNAGGHYTTLNISPPAAQQADKILAALQKEMARRSRMDGDTPLAIAISRAGLIRTLLHNFL